MRKENHQYGGEGHVDFRLTGAFQPVVEAYGALEQLEVVDRKYAQSFAHGVMESIPAGSIYFGGTDPGRFLITAFSKSHEKGEPFFTLTQNALADGTYLVYLRSMYEGKIYTPTAADSEQCFKNYLADAQKRLKEGTLKPEEHVKVTDEGAVQVSGIDAVMEINGLLTKTIFDKNPSCDFYIEESWALDWIYPHLTPHGLIFKINREPLNELSEATVQQDQDYWNKLIAPMIGDWLQPNTPLTDVTSFAKAIFQKHDLHGFKGDASFVQSMPTCAMYSKERNSIAGLYQWRMEHAASPAEKARMAAAAELAYRQAFALCPSGTDTVKSYVHFLMAQQRMDDARAVAQAAVATSPTNETLGKTLGEVIRKASR